MGNALRYAIMKKYVPLHPPLASSPAKEKRLWISELWMDRTELNRANGMGYSPAVEFCGYTIPHPSDAKMHLRIQTTGKKSPAQPNPAHPRAETNIPREMVWVCTNLFVCGGIENTTALEALEKGFSDLMDLCDVVSEKFTEARDSFNVESGNKMQS